MANANIVHSGYGFRCTATEQNLPLTLGLDGSAVLARLAGLPDGWWTPSTSCLLPHPP